MAQEEGIHTQLYAAYQLRYGEGLGSNIAVPSVVLHSKATSKLKEKEVPKLMECADVGSSGERI